MSDRFVKDQDGNEALLVRFDALTASWLRRLSAVLETPPEHIVASMMNDIREDDEFENELDAAYGAQRQRPKLRIVN